MSFPNDLKMYSDYADEWWREENSKFKSLQRISLFKVALIQKWVGDLSGLSVVDLGCGGGLLSIPLGDLGANVIGIDISEPSIKVAVQKSKSKAQFLVGDIRNTNLPGNSADLVILADVLDHIEDYYECLKEASRIAKKDGLIFVSTINRTLLSKVFAIYLGEGLGFIPKGTHDYKLFIKPDELISKAKQAGLRHLKTQGEFPKLFSSLTSRAIEFRESSSNALAYSVLFKNDL
jgi:2-polyprenyl-6-hydroxyphenyl methylase/3-demethylubiquinone-9 3-methyltransferase